MPNPVEIIGTYRATPVTYTDGPVQILTDSQGRILVGSAFGGGITYTDKTITSATGSSQTLAAANAARKSIIIKNGASVTGVNLIGGTAVIGGAGTLTLQAFESLTMAGSDCPAGAITVISTAAAYISALEGV